MYQKLFDYLNKQFGITPVETELQEIERLLLISENSWRVPVDVSVLSNLIEGSEMFGHAIIDGYQHVFDPQNHPDWDSVIYLKNQYEPYLNAAREILKSLPADKLSDYLIFEKTSS